MPPASMTVAEDVEHTGARVIAATHQDLEASARLVSIIPRDSLRVLLKDAQFSVADSSGHAMMSTGTELPPPDQSRFIRDGVPSMAAHRTLVTPSMVLSVAAPTADDVGPFERAGRVGLVVLLAVIVVALVLVGRALRNVQRLDNVVTGSLVVARSGRSQMSRVDLVGVIRSAATNALNAFVTAGANMTVPESDSKVLVRDDAIALEQLFMNLLLNAAQAVAPGGGATVTCAIDGNQHVIVVADTGPGMSPTQLARVGQPLRSTKPGGTGLGLTIASKIAEAHGGSIAVENGAPAGIVVSVRLPSLE